MVGFLGWLLVMGVSTAWQNNKSDPARLVGRFNHYLTRWDVARDRLDEAQVADLIGDLSSPQPPRRWQAAERLGDSAAKVATPALVAALRDGQGTERTCQIAHNLGRIGDRRAVPALIQAINHPRNTDLRVCATLALGDIGDARALEPLQISPDARSHPRIRHQQAIPLPGGHRRGNDDDFPALPGAWHALHRLVDRAGRIRYLDFFRLNRVEGLVQQLLNEEVEG